MGAQGEIDGEQAVGAKATRGGDKDFLAFATAEERGAEGRIDGQAAVGGVGFLRANQLKGVDLAGIDVLQEADGSKHHLLGDKPASDEDFTARDLFFQVTDLAVEHQPAFAGQQVLLIVSRDPKGTGFAQVVENLWADHPPQKRQFPQQPPVAGARDGNPGHWTASVQLETDGGKEKRMENVEYPM